MFAPRSAVGLALRSKPRHGTATHLRTAARVLLFAAVAGGVLAFWTRRSGSRDGEGRPFSPANDSDVVETLPRASGDPHVIEAKRLRRLLASNPRDLDVAARLARLEIDDARSTSDPRHLGYAQAALVPWWADAGAPAPVLILRATIRQSRHDFTGALSDLERAIVVAPDDPQVWLTRAVVLSVLGRYGEAAQSCRPLSRIAASLVSTVCVASIQGITGHALEAARRLAGELYSVAPGDPMRAWGLSVLAELTAWAGNHPEARRLAAEALAGDPNDAYTRALLADLSIADGRAADVPPLLAGREQNDGLLLRLAIAEDAIGAAGAAVHIRDLAARFDAARARGDALHGREEARFWLVIRRDPERALALARANWQVQHEPADAQILMEAALGAHQPEAAEPAVIWARETGFQDPAVLALRRRIEEAGR